MKTIKLFIIAAIIALAAALLGCEDKPDKPSVGNVKIGEGRSGGDDNLKGIIPETVDLQHPVYRYTPFFNKKLFNEKSWYDNDSVEVRVEVDFRAPGVIDSIWIEGAKVGDNENWALKNKKGSQIVFDRKTQHVEHWIVKKPTKPNENNGSYAVNFIVKIIDKEKQIESAEIIIDFGGVGAFYYVYTAMDVVAGGDNDRMYYSLVRDEVSDVAFIDITDFECRYIEGNPTVRKLTQENARDTRFYKLNNNVNNPNEWWDSSASGNETLVNVETGDLILFTTQEHVNGYFFVKEANETNIKIQILDRKNITQNN